MDLHWWFHLDPRGGSRCCCGFCHFLQVASSSWQTSTCCCRIRRVRRVKIMEADTWIYVTDCEKWWKDTDRPAWLCNDVRALRTSVRETLITVSLRSCVCYCYGYFAFAAASLFSVHALFLLFWTWFSPASRSEEQKGIHMHSWPPSILDWDDFRFLDTLSIQ